MARKSIDYTHNDTGTKPPSLNFEQGDTLDPEDFDWFWYTVINRLKGHNDEFTRLDSDNDGVVDEADYANDADASTFKGNDLDNDGDGKVDAAETADDATTLQGNTPSQLRNANQYKGNDIDSNGDGKVDAAETADSATNADDATTLQGNTPSQLRNANQYKGNDIDSDGDGKVDNADVADNASYASSAGDSDTVDDYEGQELYESGGQITLPSIDLLSGNFVSLVRYPSLPSNTTLDINRATVSNGSFNSPAGLNLIIYDATNNTILKSYNGYNEVNDSIDVSGLDILLAVDNGEYGSGTGSEQTNVTAELSCSLN